MASDTVDRLAKRAERATEKAVLDTLELIQSLDDAEWGVLTDLKRERPGVYSAVEAFGRLTPGQRRTIVSLLASIPEGELLREHTTASINEFSRLRAARILLKEEEASD